MPCNIYFINSFIFSNSNNLNIDDEISKEKSLKNLIGECIEAGENKFVDNRILKKTAVFIWIRQILKALDFLHSKHSKKIIHGNLNPK